LGEGLAWQLINHPTFVNFHREAGWDYDPTKIN